MARSHDRPVSQGEPQFHQHEFEQRLASLDLGDPEAAARELFDAIGRDHFKAEALWHVAATLRWAYGRAREAATYTALGVLPPDPIHERVYLDFAGAFSAHAIVAGTLAKAERLARRR